MGQVKGASLYGVDIASWALTVVADELPAHNHSQPLPRPESPSFCLPKMQGTLIGRGKDRDVDAARGIAQRPEVVAAPVRHEVRLDDVGGELLDLSQLGERQRDAEAAPLRVRPRVYTARRSMSEEERRAGPPASGCNSSASSLPLTRSTSARPSAVSRRESGEARSRCRPARDGAPS